ncbi:SAM-dependent methyltransferase [Cesiribacter sp. SM1]|uniref:SAM-dependent methyltransferase n=1 Tax=Cesiribacter sp. SM1 TaxID=2861196 RepID=UPI001CD7B60D|nr:SAM-dependent methyltransferase [Cesiribacter sp. SM1]
MQEKKWGRLFLIPSVLAENTAAAVIPQQVQELCKELKYYLCENIRTSRRFLSSLKLGLTIEELQFEELSKDTPDAGVPDLLAPLLQGHDVGLLSEAGCPAVADPGARAVAHAHKLGIQVVPLVGPSSILLALMASGLNGQEFAFKGYLPVKNPQRINTIKELEKNARAGQSQIFMETPYRNNQLLADVLQSCQPGMLLCIAANITAPEEFVRTRTIAEWKKNQPDLHKQPVIFILGSVPSYKS